MTSPPTDPNSTIRRRPPSAWLPTVGLAAWVIGAVAVWVVGVRWPRAIGEILLAEFVWLLVLAVVARDAVRNLFGPVFTYEALRLGRKKSTFILRGLYVVAIMALLAYLYLAWLESTRYRSGTNTTVPPRELARFATQFFLIFEVVQYCVVVLLTPAYVAGAIADEKERKTLEFLLATDLRNREIVFGKMAARVANVLMYVLAGLPVVAFLQLFGGIDPELLLVATVVTVAVVLGLSALGTYFSCVLRKPRDAIALTYMAGAVYAVASLGISIVLVGLSKNPQGITVLGFPIDGLPLKELADWVSAGNLAYAVPAIVEIASGGTNLDQVIPPYLARFLIFWGVVGVVLVALATARLRKVALAEPVVSKRTGWGGRTAARRRRPAVGDDPMFWKEVFAEPGVRGGCAGKVVGGIIVGMTLFVPVMIVALVFGDMIPGLPELFGGYQSSRPFVRRWDDFVESMNAWVRGATGVLSMILFLAATVRGAGSVSGERDRDTWITLASTPLGAWEMLSGKWWGVVLGLRPIVTLILVVWAMGLLVGAVQVVMILAAAVALCVYTAAFAWLGVLCSVTARTTMIATVRSILAALFIAGGFWVAIGCCCALPMSYGRVGSGSDDIIETAGQFLLGCTPSFVLGWLPMSELTERELGVFRHRDGLLGPLAPAFGLVVWAGMAVGFASFALDVFKRDSLRGETPRRLPPPARRTPREAGP